MALKSLKNLFSETIQRRKYTEHRVNGVRGIFMLFLTKNWSKFFLFKIC